jgi:glycerophosphoryl diester phosphodiesterase
MNFFRDSGVGRNVFDNHLGLNMVSIKVLGHRGMGPGQFEGLAENTLRGFKRALKEGAHGIELDVHLTKDGIPMVIHDNELPKKLTSPKLHCPQQLYLDQYDAADVKRSFRVGESKLRIPTLEDVLRLVKANNKQSLSETHALINIELKDNYPQLVKAVYEVIKQNLGNGVEWESIYFNSFQHDKLRELGQLHEGLNLVPNLKTAFLFGPDQMGKSGKKFEVDSTVQHRAGLFSDLLSLRKTLPFTHVDCVINDLRPSFLHFLSDKGLGLFTSTSYERLKPSELLPLLRELVENTAQSGMPSVIFKADEPEFALTTLKTYQKGLRVCPLVEKQYQDAVNLRLNQTG